MYTTKQDFINLCLLTNGDYEDTSEAYLEHLGEVYDDFEPAELEVWFDTKMAKLADQYL